MQATNCCMATWYGSRTEPEAINSLKQPFAARSRAWFAKRSNTSDADDRHVPEQVTEQVMRLVKALGTHESSSREIMELLGLKHRPTFLYDYLQPAINVGFIDMTLPDKPRSSKQRYRIVDPVAVLSER